MFTKLQGWTWWMNDILWIFLFVKCDFLWTYLICEVVTFDKHVWINVQCLKNKNIKTKKCNVVIGSVDVTIK